MHKTRRLPLGFHALPLAAAFILPNLVTPLLELWRTQIGFSATVLTLVFVAYISGLGPAFLLAPAFATKFGRKQVLLAALLFGMTSCVLYFMAGSVTALLTARFFTGLCSGLVMVLGTVAIKEEARSTETSKAPFFATVGIAVGLAGGPLLAGVVAKLLPAPTKSVFIIEAFFLFFAILVVGTQKATARKSPDSWLPFQDLDTEAKQAIFSGLGVFAPGMTAAAILLALSPTILQEMGDLQGPLAAGLLAGGMYAVSPVAQVIAKALPNLKIMHLSLVIIVLSMLLMVWALATNNLWILGISAGLIGAGQGLSNLGSFGFLQQKVSPSQIAGATALLSLGTYAAATIVPILGGFLLDSANLVTAGLGMAAAILVMCAAGSIASSPRFLNPR